MRHHIQALGMGAILLFLTAVPASALVEPIGNVLPDYDIRLGGVVADGTVGSPDGSPATPPVAAHTPDAAQVAAVAQLRNAGLSDLKVTWEPSNGMPRMLHSWGKPMTQSSVAEPVMIARAFLHQNRELFRLSHQEIDNLVVLRNYGTHDVFRTVWLGQQVNGILVNHGAIRFNLDMQGRVVWASSGYLQPGLVVDTNAAVSPEEAVIAAAGHIGIQLHEAPERITPLTARTAVFRPGQFLSPVTARVLIFPLKNGRGVLSWEVLLEPKNGVTAAWYAVTIAADSGELLHRTNITKYVTNAGHVFNGNYPTAAATHDPLYNRGVNLTTEDFGYRWQSTTGWTIPAPYSGTVGSTSGGPQFWRIDYFNTNGNNVETREDLDGDNQGSDPLPTAATGLGYQPNAGPLQEFYFPWNDLYASSTMTTDYDRIIDSAADRDALITNLYYWNNLWHDVMYGYGFDEGSGNFQFDNFSRGGCGTDAVQADAMDNAFGGSTNNANFGTPAEPMPADCAANAYLFRPRMQQYITRFGAEATPTWRGDTSLDADVIIHEFSHGTSHRLVGGPFVAGLNKHQSGSMGEGWGDWYAANYFNDPVMGEYSFADPVAGVRNFAMDVNPRTYADVCDTQCQVHYNGEVWATCLWFMRQNVGRDIAFQLVTDGMKFSVVDPIMPEMRDGILIADQVRYAGAHHCQIWDAFFQREMGFDASSPDGAFPIPDNVFTGPNCSGWAHVRHQSNVYTDTDGDGLHAINEPISIAMTLQNFDGASTATAVSATVVALTPLVTMTTPTQTFPNIAAGGTGASVGSFVFRADPGFLCGATRDFRVDITWSDAGGTHTRSDFFSVSGGAIDGPRLFWDNAEGAPSAMTGNTAVVTTQNHTAGGSRSYYTLSGCFAGPVLGCGGANSCNASCNAVELPEVQLPTNRAAVLSFWATYNSEEAWDGVVVRISKDSGATWTELNTVDYPGTLTTHTVGCAPAAGAAINGPSGNSALAPWTQFSGSLAAFAGERVLIQIAQHMSNCTEFEGSYIDDIAVTVQHCTTSPFVDSAVLSRTLADGINVLCTDNDGIADPGEIIEMDFLVMNTGNTAATNFTTNLASLNPNAPLLTAAAINFGTVNAGSAVNALYRYTVLPILTTCSEVADFNLSVTADGGYSGATSYSDVLRQDSGVQTWTDDMEGAQLPWTPSLGPNGTQQDFAIRSLDCAANGRFWSTNVAMVDPTVCGSGEPDYSPDSDSLLTSPPIDLGASGAQLTRMGWRGGPTAYGANWGGTLGPGFVEVSIDHDGDGIFTVLANWPMGRNSINYQQLLDIQNNPAMATIAAAATQQVVQVRFRLRALGPDPSAGRSADGLLVDDFWLEWKPCDLNLCTAGLSTQTGPIGNSTATTNSISRGRRMHMTTQP